MKTTSKLIVALLLILVVTTATTVSLISRIFNENLYEEDLRWTATLSSALAESIAQNTIHNRVLPVHDLINKVTASNKEIEYVIVTDFSGNIFTHTFQDGVPKKMLKVINKKQQARIKSAHGEIINYTHPIVPELDSYIHIGINLTQLKSTTQHISWQILIIAAISGLLAIVVFTLTVVRINRPLSQLSTLMERFGRGEKTEVMPTPAASREITRLVESFNAMINARNHAVHTLAEQKVLLEAIFENIPDALVLANADRKIVSVNRAFSEIFGYTESEVMYQDTLILYESEAEYERQGKLRFNQQADVKTTPYTVRYRRHNGSIFFGETLGTKVTTPEGELLGFVAVIRDISDRIATEKDLVSFKNTLDLISDCVFMFDPDTLKFFYINQGGLDQIGYSHQELLNMTPVDIKPDFNETSFRNMIEPLVNGEKSFLIFETIHQTKSGQRVPVDIFLQYVKPVHDQPRFVAVVRDITERKLSEARLQAHTDELERIVEKRTRELRIAKEDAEHANRAKSDFLSRMSHELRTPMNAILGFTQILEYDKRYPLTEVQKSSVDEILHAGDHLLQLINEILDLSRIESGRFEVSIEAVDLNHAIGECLSFVAPLAETTNVSINNTISQADNVWLQADKLRLKQVLINLLTNAIKYNRPAGSVTISAHSLPGKLMRVEISDTGVGIPEENLEKIFLPFERSSRTEAIEGTGIGLSITKHLVEMMGGEINVASSEQGSQFWFDLPQTSDKMTENQTTNTSNKIASKTMPGVKTFSAVYVEDNPANLKLVERMFEQRGNVTFYAATTPSQGFEIIANQRPDIILLDINLPEMSGTEMLRKLRQDPELANTPIIAISANAMPDDIAEAKAAGFDEYLTKPLQVAQFFTVIDSYLTPG